MKKVNVILAMAVFVFTTINVSAQQQPNRGQKPSPKKIFELLDKNKDGKISKEEALKAPNKRLSENFSIIDSNSNGYIEMSEVKTIFDLHNSTDSKKEKLMKLADTNKDGRVSIEEALTLIEKRGKGNIKRKKKHLKSIDTNNNGFLEPNELQKIKAPKNKNREKLPVESIFKVLDRNNDGKISKEEASKAPNKRLSKNFDRLDQNQDGYIDLKELKSVFNKRNKRNK